MPGCRWPETCTQAESAASYTAVVQCSSCGGSVPGGARFCPQCGTSQSVGDEERRVVTALFADIVGFTAVAEKLDPEEVKLLVDRTFERLVRDITSFGGVVDKLLGDGIVALFGAPIAHEDDAERAVRAGLQMQQSLAAMGAQLDSPIQMRIGINTGEVLVGTSMAGGDYTAMGDVMNSASRLETMAQPGQVLVGPTTHEATKEAIAFEAVGHLAARGRDASIQAWAAVGTVRLPGARTRRTTDFVGRDLELDLIHAQARMAVTQRRAQSTMVLGEAGIGKTRLIEEAAAMVGSQWRAKVLEGRSVPYGEANVWWPVAEIVRQAIGLPVDASQEKSAAAVDVYLESHLPPELGPEFDRFATTLLHVMGHRTRLRGGDRVRNRAEVLLALTHVLEAELSDHPVVIVLSDMHWAAEAVWELVRHVLRELVRHPLMVFMTARQAESSMAPLGRHGSVVLQLGPLDVEAARGLILQFDIDLPDEVAAELVERADGNPYFLEELAGLVSTRGDQSAVVGELRSGRLDSVPGTLRGIISARLDALEPTTRGVLESASLLGRSGPLDGLRMLTLKSRNLDSIDAELAALADADLLVIDGPRYSFRSDMVRDVAYGTLTKTARAQGHEGIATYLEADMAGGEFRSSIAAAIATHYFQAAELTNELTEVDGIDRSATHAKAIHWIREVAWRALAAGVAADGEQWFSNGLRLAVDRGVQAEFLYGRARARCEMRDVVGTRSDLERVLPLLEHDDLLAAKVLVVDGDIDRKAGDLDRAVAKLRDASERLESLGDYSHQSLALRLVGLAEGARHDDQAAREALERARETAARANDRNAEAWALQSLGLHLFRVGRAVEAGELVAEAAQMFEELDDRGGLTFARGLEAWVAFHSDDWARARRLIADVLPETQRRGDPWAEAMMLQLHASLELWSGNAVAAMETARQAFPVAERAEDIPVLVACQGVEGRALVSRARVAEGTAILEAAFALADRAGDVEARRSAAVVNTSSAARLGESERAIRWAARFDHHEGDSALVGERDLVVSLALALLQRGAVDEAAAQIEWTTDVGVLGPFHGAVSAIIAAAQGAADDAREAAAAVLASEATYLDRVLTFLALAAVGSQEGDVAARDSALAGARAELVGTDDLLTPLLIDLAAAVTTGWGVSEAQDKLRGIGVDPAGWHKVWALATQPGRTESISQAAQ